MTEVSVLSPEDWACWEEDGYVVVRAAVPPENVAAAARAVWEFSGMDRDDPSSWRTDPPRSRVMLDLYHHQALWDNRQVPRVHQAFAAIWGTEKLWVSFDRAGINPPVDPGCRLGSHLHWDLAALELPIPFQVQGVLYLTDTVADQGAFGCVAGFHRRIEEWIEGLPAGVDPKDQDLSRFERQYIAGDAGDLIIWNSALPHGNGVNSTDKPRLAQYITMFPVPTAQNSSLAPYLLRPGLTPRPSVSCASTVGKSGSPDWANTKRAGSTRPVATPI